MKYVVECRKKVESLKVGLGGERGIKWYRPGHFVTYEGHPTKDIEKAYVYDDKKYDTDFPFEEPLGSARNPIFLSDYFRKVPVEVVRTVRRNKA